jgi:hypothetical protein
MSRPSDLTQELTLQIRQLVLQGVKYLDIQEQLAIPANTWDAWVYKDYKDFRKDLQSWKAERLVRKAERLSDEILEAVHIDESGKYATDVLRIKQKEAEFVRSTLGKNEGYSTRIETTGANGTNIVSNETQELVNNALEAYLNPTK